MVLVFLIIGVVILIEIAVSLLLAKSERIGEGKVALGVVCAAVTGFAVAMALFAPFYEPAF